MQRLLIVYNPRSSRFAEVSKDVIERSRELTGYIIGKYEVAPTNLEDNISKLSKILKDDDLVLSAGGDATGIIAVNAILKSNKDVRLAVLPYGNFNDLSRTLRTNTFDDVFLSKTSVRKFYPLEVYINDKFFRYATCYTTIGMTAMAVSIYDQPEMRKKLKKNFGRKISSYTELSKWYFKNRHRHIFLPEFKLNGVLMPKKTSDYAAVNGRSMARVMKGGEDYRDPKYFRSETDRLTYFYRLVKLMSKSVLSRIPGSSTSGDVLEFTNPSSVALQAEGESQVFENVKKIEIKKGKKCLKVIEN
ncbi:acylglycerol kinase family protein [Candidatus Saccharibacteria bacterium]|nr:acylglycerol kinase family protein [Candidatus Saccharibacteria bacterium]